MARRIRTANGGDFGQSTFPTAAAPACPALPTRTFGRPAQRLCMGAREFPASNVAPSRLARLLDQAVVTSLLPERGRRLCLLVVGVAARSLSCVKIGQK